MRGDGSTFLRGQVWWVAYWFRGRQYQESSKSTDEKVAKKLLRQRLREIHSKRRLVNPAREQRYTIHDLKNALVSDYKRKNNRSTDTMEHCFKHLQNAFEFVRLIDIDAEKVTAYRDKRLTSGAARSTINRELAYLRHGFNLMFKQRTISDVPTIEFLGDENVRDGFIDIADFRALLENIPNQDVRDIVEFLYLSGWRSREAKCMPWPWIDSNANMVKLPKEYSKSKKDRLLPLVGDLANVIERRIKLRRLDCAFVFHRNGQPIRSFRRAFKAAAKAIGQPQLLPHDMRRSAVRNFRKAGLSENEGMALSGHKTRSVYDRYNIISEDDMTKSMQKVQEHLKREAKKIRKVVPLKRETA